MLSRIVITLTDDHPCKGLTRALEEKGLEVIHPDFEDASLLEGALLCSGDLFILPEAILPKPAGEIINLLKDQPEQPQILVLVKEDSPSKRAELLVEGCDSVLSEETSIDNLVAIIESLLTKRMEIMETILPSTRPLADPNLSDFVSNSPAMCLFIETVKRVVHASSSLLLLGETGVGKERLARAIHAESTRGQHPFVAINCGALPETLLESELFGHEEGAFTGASRAHRGCFELSHGGTLFLDEIGEMPLHLQVKLLRALQEKEIQRLGSEKTIHIDVRIIAATNRDLKTEVKEKRFRSDLYYRLSVVSLEIPPLRERKEDIPELIQNYLEFLRHRVGVEVNKITSPAVNALCSYDWPGNIRELINVIERAMLLCNDNAITFIDLPNEIQMQLRPELQATSSVPGEQLPDVSSLLPMPHDWETLPWKDVRRAVVASAEKVYFTSLLTRAHGRIGDAATLAGIEPRSLHAKLKTHRIRKENFKLRQRD